MKKFKSLKIQIVSIDNDEIISCSGAIPSPDGLQRATNVTVEEVDANETL